MTKISFIFWCMCLCSRMCRYTVYVYRGQRTTLVVISQVPTAFFSKLSNRPGKLDSGSQESTCLSSFIVLGYKYVPLNLEFCSLSFSLTLVVGPLS